MDCSKVNIKKGSTGKAVQELQTYLQYLRFYTQEVDGKCGDYTVEAIKKMQKAYDVKVDGIFGFNAIYVVFKNRKQTESFPAYFDL